MMTNVLLGLLIVVLALVSTAVTEVLSIAILTYAPPGWDVGGSFVLLAVFPSALIVIAMAMLVGGRVFRRRPAAYTGLFWAVMAVVYATYLTGFANPVVDVMRYEIAITLAIALTAGWRLFRRGPALREARGE